LYFTCNHGIRNTITYVLANFYPQNNRIRLQSRKSCLSRVIYQSTGVLERRRRRRRRCVCNFSRV